MFLGFVLIRWAEAHTNRCDCQEAGTLYTPRFKERDSRATGENAGVVRRQVRGDVWAGACVLVHAGLVRHGGAASGADFGLESESLWAAGSWRWSWVVGNWSWGALEKEPRSRQMIWVGLHIKGMSSGKLFAISRNQLTLGGAVPLCAQEASRCQSIIKYRKWKTRLIHPLLLTPGNY